MHLEVNNATLNNAKKSKARKNCAPRKKLTCIFVQVHERNRLCKSLATSALVVSEGHLVCQAKAIFLCYSCEQEPPSPTMTIWQAVYYIFDS